MSVLAECRDALLDTNVQAFLRVIREGETNQELLAYRMIFGGQLFTSFDDHPRERVWSEKYKVWSTAAGAYQFLSRTWDGVAKALQLPDFSPPMQDLGAVYLIRGRGALADVKAGRLEVAIAKCAREWASLPGSPYGQATQPMKKARAVYEQFGGTYAVVAAPPALAPLPESPMPIPALLAAIAPLVLNEIPRIIARFGSGSEVAQRNTELVKTVMEIGKEAIGASNEQELLERMTSDPAAAQSVREAVDLNWLKIDEAREKSVADAREFIASRPERVVWANMLFHELLALVFVVLTFAGMATAFVWGELSQSTKDIVVTAALIGGFLGIKEFFYGGSRGSDTKTEMMRDTRKGS